MIHLDLTVIWGTMYWTDELDDDDFLYFDISHLKSRHSVSRDPDQEGIIGSDLN